MDDRNLRAYMAELLGTFAFVFISAGSVFTTALLSGPGSSLVVALATGLVYASLLAVTLPLGGGYLNPSITLMLWVFKRLNGFKATGLIFSQFLGATLAGLLLYLVLPGREDLRFFTRIGTPTLNLDAFAAASVTLGPLLKGIGIEMGLTFVLVLVVFGLNYDPRALRTLGPWANRLLAFWVGLALVAITLVGMPLTGAAVNPARWFGPWIWDAILQPSSDALRSHAAYWIGPTLGALLAGWAYTGWLMPADDENVMAHSTGHPASVHAPAGTLARVKK